MYTLTHTPQDELWRSILKITENIGCTGGENPITSDKDPAQVEVIGESQVTILIR